MSGVKVILKTVIWAVLSVLVTEHVAVAQVDTLARIADSLHRSYCFDDALAVYDLILEMAEDSTVSVDSATLAAISRKLVLSENGSNMSQFVRKPKMVSRRMSSVDDFYLYYPLENHSWRRLPNQLDSVCTDTYVRALYAPDWNDIHYFSAVDENGFRSIFVTELHDTLWTQPKKVEDISTPISNEICPMLSPDGKTLYFASDGFYGMGGYDIYYSSWNEDEGRWSMPQNMGMPFSSPADDFLFIDSEDERHSLFASTRDCPADSVWIYVLEYDRYPLHSAVTDPDELKQLSMMAPHDKKTEETSVKPENEQPKDDVTSVYMTQMDKVRELKDSIEVISSRLDDLRQDLAFSNDAGERFSLSEDIMELERDIPGLQMKLEEAKVELQKIEYEFLKKGIFINRNSAEEQSVVEEQAQEYVFKKLSHGEDLHLNMYEPENDI